MTLSIFDIALRAPGPNQTMILIGVDRRVLFSYETPVVYSGPEGDFKVHPAPSTTTARHISAQGFSSATPLSKDDFGKFLQSLPCF